MKKKNLNERRLELILESGVGDVFSEEEIRRTLEYAFQTYSQRSPDYLAELIVSPLPSKVKRDYAEKIFSMLKVHKIQDFDDCMERIDQLLKLRKYLSRETVRSYLIDASKYIFTRDGIDAVVDDEYSIYDERFLFALRVFNELGKFNGRRRKTKEFSSTLRRFRKCTKELKGLSESYGHEDKSWNDIEKISHDRKYLGSYLTGSYEGENCKWREYRLSAKTAIKRIEYGRTKVLIKQAERLYERLSRFIRDEVCASS